MWVTMLKKKKKVQLTKKNTLAPCTSFDCKLTLNGAIQFEFSVFKGEEPVLPHFCHNGEKSLNWDIFLHNGISALTHSCPINEVSTTWHQKGN